MPSPKLKKKKVKAKGFVFYKESLKDIGDQIFTTRKAAREFVREIAYHSSPLVMKEYLKKVKKNYKIVPCEITYFL